MAIPLIVPVVIGIAMLASGGKKDKMPRTNPHASALQQDKQLREQIKWLKASGFKSPREAQEAGY